MTTAGKIDAVLDKADDVLRRAADVLSIIEKAEELGVFAVPYRNKWVSVYWQPDEVEQQLLEVAFNEEDLRDTFVEALQQAVAKSIWNHKVDALENYRD